MSRKIFITFSLLTSLITSAICNEKNDHFLSDKMLLTYKDVDGVKLKLHIFNPKNHKAGSKSPAVVFFFGGGWVGGTPRQFFQQCKFLAKNGMVAISADYRTKKRHNSSPFESVKDAKSAIRYVRTNAYKLGIDPERVVAGGGSAGGHLALCTGVVDGLEEEGENLSISSRPNAIVAMNPVLDTTEKGYGSEKVKGRETDISPCHKVKKGIPPTIIFHGTADQTVPFENATRFTKLMTEAENDCQLVAFKGKDHGFFNGNEFRKSSDNKDFEKIMSETVSFLMAHEILPKLPKTVK